MGVLQEADSMSVIHALMTRGLSGEQINRAMKQMVGSDWREVHVSTWHRRLKNEGLIIHENEEIFVDDLEALVNGRIKLDELSRRHCSEGQA
jgi:hypothetical protein